MLSSPDSEVGNESRTAETKEEMTRQIESQKKEMERKIHEVMEGMSKKIAIYKGQVASQHEDREVVEKSQASSQSDEFL